jgi:hypothetical protein
MGGTRLRRPRATGPDRVRAPQWRIAQLDESTKEKLRALGYLD